MKIRDVRKAPSEIEDDRTNLKTPTVTAEGWCEKTTNRLALRETRKIKANIKTFIKVLGVNEGERKGVGKVVQEEMRDRLTRPAG